MRTFADRLRKKGYEEGKRQGYAMGMAEGLVEVMAETLADGISKALEDVLTEHFLHCIERGRAGGMKEILRGVVERRFGEEVADKFEKLVDPVDAAETLEKLVESIVLSKTDEGLLESVRKDLEKMAPADTSDGASERPN